MTDLTPPRHAGAGRATRLSAALGGVALAVYLVCGCSPAAAPVQDHAGASRAEAAETRAAPAFPAPDRPVAEIVSPMWLNEADRDEARESAQVVRLLGVRPGMAVADVGAGSGYHTVRLSRVVGPQGRVYAQDITPSYLADLTARVRKAGLANVTVVRGRADDPGLPAGSVDAALLVHMYHEIAQPYAFLYNLAPALRPGARVGVVDLDRRPENHGTPPALLRCELAAVGYRQVGFHTLTGNIGYLAVFEPPARRPAPSAIRACKAD